jgi:predicted ABC-type transport system involved in lysophospholipase L1 biosynthesis ATPase subunit
VLTDKEIDFTVCVNNLCKTRHWRQKYQDILKGISFEIKEARALPSAGASGAGNIATGLLAGLDASSGDIFPHNQNISVMTEDSAPEAKRARHVDGVPAISIVAGMTALENDVATGVADIVRLATEAKQFLDKVGLADAWSLSRVLSGGEQHELP